VLGLPAPTGVRISQAFDVDAARQPPFDCCLDQLGSEKRKRKREINLTYRAALAFCQLLRIVDCAGHDFVEPASASRDGADQANASFGALGSDMFADGSVRQQCASSRGRWSMRDTIAARKSALAAQFFTSSLTTSLTCRRTSAGYFAGRVRGHNA